MAAEEVHAAVRSIYRGALDYAEGVKARADALASGDNAAAEKAAERASEAWCRGIADAAGYLVTIIEVHESADRQRKLHAEDARVHLDRIRDIQAADTDHPSFCVVPNREIAQLVLLLTVDMVPV